MKKLLCILLVTLLALSAQAGCAQKTEDAFTADNEIFTYQRIDPKRTQIVVSRTGNIDVHPLCLAFEAENPDIQVIYLDITGGNDAYKPLNEWIARGYAPDVVFSAASFFDDKHTIDYFENLSANPIIENYEAAALQRTAVAYDVYSLPGPSNISAMMYNKTLFAQYGWEVPATFDEFVALCDRITADTNGEIEPWNPNAKYSQELQIALEAFTYEELFGGADNRSWYNDFIAGNATFTGHMEPYMEVIQTLADHNILREEHYSYSATARGKEFTAGKIAMINVNIYNADTDAFDFGYMPFPTTKGTLGYISDSFSCFTGLPIKEHTAQENDAINRFLAYLSSPDGQRVYIGSSMKVSNVKNVPLASEDDLAVLQPAIDAGHMFAALDFRSASGSNGNVNLYQNAMDITSGVMTPAECIAMSDTKSAPAAPAPEEAAPETLATAKQDMTMLETSFYIADMYREAAGADIGLITHNEAYRGNLMRIFAGDLTPQIVTVLKPRSFGNDATLVKVSMTGQQLLDALNNPAGNEETPDCIYAYAGLKCTIAPWNALGEKYLSVKLADGSALDPNRLYTVGCWAGTIKDAYITEQLEAYEGAWEEHMSAKLRTDGTIAPAGDGRVKLVWN